MFEGCIKDRDGKEGPGEEQTLRAETKPRKNLGAWGGVSIDPGKRQQPTLWSHRIRDQRDTKDLATGRLRDMKEGGLLWGRLELGSTRRRQDY